MQSLIQSCGSKLQFPDYRSGLLDILAKGSWDKSDVRASNFKISTETGTLEDSSNVNIELLQRKVFELEKTLSEVLLRQEVLEVC
jgi:hypothetical protein